MSRQRVGFVCSLGLAIAIIQTGCLLGAFRENNALAQITPDDTLGAERSVITPLDTQGLPVDRIDGGAIRGTNLFHSFEDFNVTANRGAYFFSPANIQNILARVTGRNPSQILGTLGTFGDSNPNLFLINPNGIIFSQDARLDVGGSFVASTASAIKFADGTEFSTSNPSSPRLLTVNIPIGLQFGRNPGRIFAQGDGQGIRRTLDLIDTNNALRVPTDQTLALVGGDVVLEGATLKTAGGRIELGSVAEEGLVTLTPSSSGWTLGYQGIQNFGNIQLSDTASVDASGTGSGEVQIQGRRITLTNGSRIQNVTLGAEVGGALSINASEAVEVIGRSGNGRFSSGLVTDVYPGATGRGGDLMITTARLSVRDGALVSATSQGLGNAGDLIINASESVDVVRSRDTPITLVTTQTFNSTGNAGNLQIATKRLLVEGAAQISSGTFGEGKSGNLIVEASDSVEVVGTTPDGRFASGLFSTSSGNGDAGDLFQITTGRLIVRDGAQVGAGTFGAGKGGNFVINATESIEVIGAGLREASGIFSQAGPRSTNNAGNLEITTNRVIVRDGGQISAGTFGSGEGGKLSVTATDSIEVIGVGARTASGLFSQAEPNSRGDGGNLEITTNRLIVRDGGQVSASTFSLGRGGELDVTATDLIEVSGVGVIPEGSFAGDTPSRLAVRSEGSTSGDSGNLTVNTKRLSVRDGAEITASTSGQGNAGSILVQDAETVFLSNASISSAVKVSALGEGGNINIQTGLLSLENRAQITASSLGNGAAGNIQVTADSIRLNTQSSLNANTVGGQGNINLNSVDLVMRRGSEITTNATGQDQIGGNINLNTGVLVALENSDIAADSVDFRGGNVTITTQAIFGTEFRPTRTPNSDITASGRDSTLNGTVQINLIGIDPSQGLTNLPTDVADASNQIAQTCTTDGGQVARNQFIVTGRGGLPTNPYEPLGSSDLLADVQPPTQWGENLESTSSSSSSTLPSTTPKQIVEAREWMINDNGEVVLVADVPPTSSDWGCHLR